MLPTDPLYSALVKTIFLVDDTNQRFFEQFGLGTTRFYALIHIADNPGISMSLLSERLLCSKGNTTRVVRSLETAALIERVEDSQDSRAVRLFITPPGKAMLEKIIPAYEAFGLQRFASLSPSGRSELKVSLDRLNTHLESLLPSREAADIPHLSDG